MWQLINTKDWNTIKNTFDWIADMVGVPQDPIYHAEGDVEVHTRMVVESLLTMPEYLELGEQEKQILFASALLHDVEKRSTTVLETDGRITSKGHAKKGEFTSRSILYQQIYTPFEIREAVAKLVRYHGLPLWVFEKTDPVKSVIAASLDVNTEHLAILAKADVLGRICADQKDLLYKIELFKELCRDNDCFGKARTFSNSHAKFFYLNKEQVSPDFIPFDDTAFEVIMMSGIPGAGKDTFISSTYPDMPVVSLDAIRRKLKIDPSDSKGNGRVIQEAKESAKVLMREKRSFVWNATNTSRQMREQLIDLFTSYGARVRIIYIEVPYLKLVKQNREREYQVPSGIQEKLIHKLEVPSLTEAHEVEYIISNRRLPSIVNN